MDTNPELEAMLRARKQLSSTKLHRRWLVLARTLWLGMVVLSSGLFVASVPARFEQLRRVVTSVVDVGQLTLEDVHALRRLGWSSDNYALWVVVFESVAAVAFVSVATIIFWRRSGDQIALFVSLMLALFGTIGLPTISAFTETHLMWASVVVALRAVFYSCLIIFFFVFPNGRFVPHWTRWLALGWIVYIMGTLFVAVLRPPIVIVGVDNVQTIGVIVWLFAWLGIGMAVQIHRYRHVSTLPQRQQTKWVIFGLAALFVAALVVVASQFLVPSLNDPLRFRGQYRLIGVTIILLFYVLLATTVGIATLRYRLFDIDFLIRRTLIYSVLTVILGTIYWGSVVVLQQIVGVVTGQIEQPPIVIVASTLAIAALFQPVRRRVQNVIDRRFYRRTYDAQKTLQAFSVKLRDEPDLARLSNDIVHVVEETLQPGHASLWLRKPEHKT